jgi:hypothetical protein
MRFTHFTLSCVVSLASIFGLGARPAAAADVTVGWDANREADIAGYIVAYGTISGKLTTKVDVGNLTSFTFTGLPDGRLHYFAVQAYNAAGLKSALSEEIPYAPPAMTPIIEGSARPDRIDFAWQNSVTGELAAWAVRGTELESGATLGPGVIHKDWKIRATGDFNRDRATDLIWQHTDGTVAVWFMTGTAVQDTRLLTISQVTDTDWRIIGAADFNRDSRDDIVWQHRTGGWLAVWLMWDNYVLDTRQLTPNRVDPAWRLAGLGDVNRDNSPDLIWQHTDGWLAAWYMRGTAQIDTGYLSASRIDSNWQIRGVKDLNNDLRADLVFQHTDGSLATWFMDGVRVLDTRWLTPRQVMDADWKIVGAR